MRDRRIILPSMREISYHSFFDMNKMDPNHNPRILRLQHLSRPRDFNDILWVWIFTPIETLLAAVKRDMTVIKVNSDCDFELVCGIDGIFKRRILFWIF